jgi:hypothetical protein
VQRSENPAIYPTDASVTGLDAVIYQLLDGHPRPIAYISHAFGDAGLN